MISLAWKLKSTVNEQVKQKQTLRVNKLRLPDGRVGHWVEKVKGVRSYEQSGYMKHCIGYTGNNTVILVCTGIIRQITS